MTPESIDISCPVCGSLAAFEEPFMFQTTPPDKKQQSPVHQWGGWYVVERFPEQFSWSPPKGSEQFLRWGGENQEEGYPLLTVGKVLCSTCYKPSKHHLNWPKDAYWQWEIRGETLWAWSREHADLILSYISSTQRSGRSSPALRYIPSHFLTAKVREEIVKKMTTSIESVT